MAFYEDDEMVEASEVDTLKGEHEPDEHWSLRREFILAHRDTYPIVKLLSLSQTYCNIEKLGCLYPCETMKLIAELSEEVGAGFRKRKLELVQRHTVDASAAAEQKIKRLRPNPTEANSPSTQTKVVYGPLVTKGPSVTYGPPVSEVRPKYSGVRSYNTGNYN